MHVRLMIVGELDPDYEPHVATASALHHAADNLGLGVTAQWMSSSDADERSLAAADGVFMAPGLPYSDLDRALSVVSYCLRSGTPLTGTCSGFQHAVVALAREAGITDATHEDYGLPGTVVVTRLTCSIAGTIGEVHIEPGTVAHRLYRLDRVREEHRCNFGLDPQFSSVMTAAGGVISGRGDDETPRIIEIPGHPFFLVALFLPQLASEPEHPHPLISGFVAAAAARAGSRQADAARQVSAAAPNT